MVCLQIIGHILSVSDPRIGSFCMALDGLVGDLIKRNIQVYGLWLN